MDRTFSRNKSSLLALILVLLSYVSDGTQPKPRTVNKANTSHPIPFGHLPYHPSLPGAMGPQWSFPVEWWFFGGWAQSVSQTDNQPGPNFTLYFQITRLSTDGKGRDRYTEAMINYGFGTKLRFLANYSVATGFHLKKSPDQQGLIIPPTTQDHWYCEARTTTMQMTVQLTDGMLGLAGASYKLEITDIVQGFNAVFNMYDPFGGILEYSSGNEKVPTYEYALPSLNIMNESYITVNDVKYNLVDGNLWLDREMSLYSPLSGSTSQKLNSKLFPLRHQPLAGQQMYTGEWLGIVMNNKTVYEWLINWPQKKNQWIVGDKLNPPYPPLLKYAVEYPYNSEWTSSWVGMPAIQGVSVLDQDEFDLNIFNPSNPPHSPHWTSPTTNQTYCTKWQLHIRDKQYVMTALVPESEVTVGTDSYFEGIAIISDPSDPLDQPLGYAFVEQMGYTQ